MPFGRVSSRGQTGGGSHVMWWRCMRARRSILAISRRMSEDAGEDRVAADDHPTCTTGEGKKPSNKTVTVIYPICV